KAYAASQDRGIPFQTHLGQAAQEFDEIVRRHGKTPVRFLRDLGVLGPTTTIAHGIFLDEHPQIRWHEHTDLADITASGTTIVHCPQTFAYRGAAMHHLGGYNAKGVKLAMGTDTFPHDMLNEMKLAITLSKVLSRHVDLLT